MALLVRLLTRAARFSTLPFQHIIVLDEYGKGVSEEALLSDLQAAFPNPEVFESASLCRVFSFGGGHRGVQMMQHGVAWLGLVTGAKLWHVADPELPKPSDRHCTDGGKVDYTLAAKEGVTHCLLLPGETIFVPEKWWHATCNLDEYTIGVGGQLWRPGLEESFETAEERASQLSPRTDPFDPSTWTRAEPLPDEDLAVIFDPDVQDALGGADDPRTTRRVRVAVDATRG